MESLYPQKFALYATTLSFFSKYLPPKAARLLAKAVALRISPDVLLDERINRNLYAHGYSDDDRALIINAFHKKVSLSGLELFSIANKDKLWLDKHVEIDGLDDFQASLDNNDAGVLYLSYHFHNKFVCLSVLGLLGLNMHALAMDYRGTDVYEHPVAGKYYTELFSSVEGMLNQGKPIYMSPDNSVATIKGIAKGLEKNQVLWSLNDIYSPFAGSKRNISTEFLGREIKCPVGTIDIALKKSADIYIGFLLWDAGREKYQLKFIRVSTEGGVDAVVEQYVDNLRLLITRDPSIWEGWKLLL